MIMDQDNESNLGHCKFLMDCNNRITFYVFHNICNTPRYKNCHHYSKALGELKRPIEWLQKEAVEAELHQKWSIIEKVIKQNQT